MFSGWLISGENAFYIQEGPLLFWERSLSSRYKAVPYKQFFRIPYKGWQNGSSGRNACLTSIKL
jgi:hypothetical protein